MKATTSSFFLALALVASGLTSFSQCEIHNRIYADGMMLYYIEPVNFYWTKSKSLKGGIVTDKEDFYLELHPIPFPPKPEGRKLKDELEIKLSNDSVYHLEHFDTRYMDRDTVMQLLYLIEKDDLADFLNNQVVSVKINMKDSTGPRTYAFKLHKAALQEQLKCFLDQKKEKNKK
jgi:hypothetical protein